MAFGCALPPCGLAGCTRSRSQLITPPLTHHLHERRSTEGTNCSCWAKGEGGGRRGNSRRVAWGVGDVCGAVGGDAGAIGGICVRGGQRVLSACCGRGFEAAQESKAGIRVRRRTEFDVDEVVLNPGRSPQTQTPCSQSWSRHNHGLRALQGGSCAGNAIVDKPGGSQGELHTSV